jgi:hypothetical protein
MEEFLNREISAVAKLWRDKLRNTRTPKVFGAKADLLVGGRGRARQPEC